MSDAISWAEDEFGQLNLGDRRRVRRLVVMAGIAARCPSGKVTEVFADGAHREAAFRLLENDDVDAGEIQRGAHRAGARRCTTDAFAYVPVDQTSLTITDRNKAKRLGMVGTRTYAAEGVQVMSAIAVTPDGTPQGLVGQSYWTRERGGQRKKDTRNQRNVEDKETQHWIDVIEQARSAFAEVAPETRPWFQLDRGADAWPILQLAAKSNFWLTLRATWNRRLIGTEEAGKHDHLRETLSRCRLLGQYKLEVPDGEHRSARTAKIEVRARRVTLDLWTKPSSQHIRVELYGVLAREVDTTPFDEDPIEWMLLTNYPVATFKDAKCVIL